MLSSAETYDPDLGTFLTLSAPMGVQRNKHGATLLPNGKVLLTGGLNGSSVAELTTEVYDPTDNSFTAGASMANARYTHSATLLASGRLLVAGGSNNPTAVPSAELYEAAAGTFTATATMLATRGDPTATLLSNGKVLLSGGVIGTTSQSSSELYNVASGTFSATGNMTQAKRNHTATLLMNGKVLIAGGNNAAYLASAELYHPRSGTFSAIGNMATSRSFHTATLLPNGKVLIVGGYQGGSNFTASAELYDPVTNTFSPTNSLPAVRAVHTATLLRTGKVLIAGGDTTSGPVLSALLYDPDTGEFTPTGNLTRFRELSTATLLPNGKVLITGVLESQTSKATELYDPGTGTFTAAADLTVTRVYPVATLLPNGKVLISGGLNSIGSSVQSTEIYDPGRNTFTATGSMTTFRAFHIATLLPNGKVLVAGSSSAPIPPAELYDVGDGYVESRRPVISSIPSAVTVTSAMTLAGSGFRGEDSSSGSFNSSPTNYPLLQLQRIDNDETLFITPIAWSDTSLTTPVLGDLPLGHYRVTLFVNGIPAVQRLILVTDRAVPTIMNVSPTAGTTQGGQALTVTGTNLTGASATFGNAEALLVTAIGTGMSLTTPAHAAGVVDVAVDTTGGFAIAPNAYTFFGPPANVVATAATANSVGISWTSIPGPTSYEVSRSSNGAIFTALGSTPGTTFGDPAAAPDTAYLYRVRGFEPTGTSGPYSPADLATTVIFAEDPLVPNVTAIKATHLTELRRAVNAVHVLAGLGSVSFTDDLMIRAIHPVELRSNLDSARSTLGLGALSYTDPTVTPSSTVVKAAHFMELRDGVK